MALIFTGALIGRESRTNWTGKDATTDVGRRAQSERKDTSRRHRRG